MNEFRDLHIKQIAEAQAMLALIPAEVPPPPPPPPAPPPPPPGPAVGTVLAQEGQSFTVAADSRVRYGAGAAWIERDVAAATPTQCDNVAFGNDPILGTAKRCEYVGPASGPVTPPAPPPPPAPAPPPAPDGIVTAGVIDPAKYSAMAANWWTDSAMAYRFGAPSPTTPAGTVFHERAHVPFPNRGGTYDAGIGSGFQADAGDYSSGIGYGAYVADDPEARIGAFGVTVIGVSNNTFSYYPEPSWTRGFEGLDAFDLAHPWRDNGYPVRKVLCCAQGQGRPGWNVHMLYAFAPDGSGRSFVAAAGANTMKNQMGFWLPAGLVPTCMAITNSDEFAFFGCWDTARTRAVLVVAALTSLGDNGTRANPDPYAWTQFESSWGAPRIELAGVAEIGNWMSGKVIGQIDLPTNMVAPTDMSATTSMNRYSYLSSGITGDGGSLAEMTWGGFSAANRVKLGDGGQYAGATARAGTLVITSRTEKTACFVNLAPLFAYYRSMYFTADNAKFAETRNLGDAPNQWPYTFAQAPQQAPTISTTLTLAQVPVCVHAAPWGPSEAYIGTESGHILKYSLAGALLATYSVGSNITCIRNTKEKARAVQYEKTETLIVVSRGERAIKFIDAPTGAIRKTIVPAVSQLRDPIAAADTNNHGDTSEVCVVADYTGKRFITLMYGPTILRPTETRYGPGLGGTDVAEYGGAFNLPGKAWAVGEANIS